MAGAGADNLADATEIGLNDVSDPTDALSMTLSADEAAAFGTGTPHTAWWKFTPTTSVVVDISLASSVPGPGVDPLDFDTYLRVFTSAVDSPTSVSDLTLLTQDDDDADVAYYSAVWSIPTAAGKSYYIQASQYGDTDGSYVLSVNASSVDLTPVTTRILTDGSTDQDPTIYHRLIGFRTNPSDHDLFCSWLYLNQNSVSGVVVGRRDGDQVRDLATYPWDYQHKGRCLTWLDDTTFVFTTGTIPIGSEWPYIVIGRVAGDAVTFSDPVAPAIAGGGGLRISPKFHVSGTSVKVLAIQYAANGTPTYNERLHLLEFDYATGAPAGLTATFTGCTDPVGQMRVEGCQVLDSGDFLVETTKGFRVVHPGGASEAEVDRKTLITPYAATGGGEVFIGTPGAGVPDAAFGDGYMGGIVVGTKYWMSASFYDDSATSESGWIAYDLYAGTVEQVRSGVMGAGVSSTNGPVFAAEVFPIDGNPCALLQVPDNSYNGFQSADVVYTTVDPASKATASYQVTSGTARVSRPQGVAAGSPPEGLITGNLEHSLVLVAAYPADPAPAPTSGLMGTRRRFV